MGIFYTCSYAAVAVLPAVAGLTRDLTGDPAAPLLFGGALLFVAIVVLVLFRTLQGRRRWLPVLPAGLVKPPPDKQMR
jgi:hypothetical protein